MTEIYYLISLSVITGVNYFFNKTVSGNYDKVIDLYKNAYKQQCEYSDSLAEYVMKKIINDAIDIEDFELAEQAKRHYELIKNRKEQIKNKK